MRRLRALAALGEQDVLRRRAFAFAGMWFLVNGLLTALGLIVVVLLGNLLVLVSALALGGVRLLRRLRLPAARLPAFRMPAVRLPAPRFPALRMPAVRLPTVRVQLPAPDPGRRARRLNAHGTQLRRSGDFAGAAAQHREALELLRSLDDPHAEAMTLNNLALALAKSGDDDTAVQHFEEARSVLRTLGDDEHEGQVIANLGLVHRSHGRREEATGLLHEALDKLPPESPAYHRVEAALRRAS